MIQNRFFPEINGNFGFGCMRLPQKDGKIDYDEFSRMADAFIEAGFNYFDTAHGYHGGKSETAIRDCVVKRHKREEFLLTDKLTAFHFEKNEDIRPLFKSQLEACGVDYFDFYLMHAQDAAFFEKYKKCRAYETVLELKKEGYIRHFGISFHDRHDVLDRILTEYPEIEIVQIQFNYADYLDTSVDSRAVYEVCEKHKKPCIVMEPVKGGLLVDLPEAADTVFRNLDGGSNASYALRYAGGFEYISVVLSGMSSMDQMKDNISSMKNFKPLDKKESAAVAAVQNILKGQDTIPCTGCRYCVNDNDCPADILIPDIFSAMNSQNTFGGWNPSFYYENTLTRDNGKASDCLECGLCEEVCPQHLEIRNLLKKAAELFEK